uniref:Uncharacterized protein n=1 Tax=Oryza barthii TaxID=65489 RepID=A0A0D3HII3_9ORYZ
MAWLAVDDQRGGGGDTVTVATVVCRSWLVVFVSFIWTGFVSVFLLHEALLSQVDTCNALAYSALHMLAVAFLIIFVSTIVGLLVLLLAPMAMAGLLGYCIAVYSQYKSLKGKFNVENPEQMMVDVTKLKI